MATEREKGNLEGAGRRVLSPKRPSPKSSLICPRALSLLNFISFLSILKAINQKNILKRPHINHLKKRKDIQLPPHVGHIPLSSFRLTLSEDSVDGLANLDVDFILRANSGNLGKRGKVRPKAKGRGAEERRAHLKDLVEATVVIDDGHRGLNEGP